MNDDKYEFLAKYYDKMKTNNLNRIAFLKIICSMYDNPKILDCSCGTGRDAYLLNELGYDISCSDYSDSMLKVCRNRFKQNQSVKIVKADFQKLQEIFNQEFDIILCLSNSINEEDVDPYKALNSMKSVLNINGVIVFDQGQTDFSMCNPPRYHMIANDRDFSRLLTMGYADNIMTVNIFDFVHSEEENDFSHNKINISIRLFDEWETILRILNLDCMYYGDWLFNQYDKQSSMRLIMVAKKVE